MSSRQGRTALLLLAATCLCDLPVAVRSVAFVPNAFCHAPLARPAGPWRWQAREASGKRRAGGAGAQARRAASGVAALIAQVKPPGKTTPAPAVGAATPAVSASQYTWFFLALPALSAAFPALVEAAQAATEQEDRRALIIAFLILKRVYLYACAASIVDIAARRSRDVPQRLGERMQQLNAEIFSGVLSRQQMAKLDSTEARAALSELNQVSGGAQAAGLPVFLALVLGGSFALTQLLAGSPPAADVQDTSTLALLVNPILGEIGGALRAMAPFAAVPLQAAVCVTFMQAEVKAALQAILPQPEAASGVAGLASPANASNVEPTPLAPQRLKLAVVASAAVTAGAYVLPPAAAWPLRNLVNSCIAVTVARGLQLPTLPLVAAALSGLVAYDTLSVYGTGALVAPAAAAEAAAGASQASQSVMEAVARAKLSGSGPWQPGLLSVVVGGKTTDALGLGDAVFPAMLSGWALRRDLLARGAGSEGGEVYFKAAMGGYCIGCFLCEVTNSGGGQPALLVLVPAMLATVLTTATVRGELLDIWRQPGSQAP